MRRRDAIVMVLIFVVGFAAGHGVPGRVGRPATDAPAERGTERATTPATPLAPLPEGLTGEERRDIEVFRRAQASVVFITSVALRRDTFSFDVQQIPKGTGSGFVWDRQGHVVTNFHVIQDGNAFSVTLADQSEWDATIVGVAPEKDLAVLNITAPADK